MLTARFTEYAARHQGRSVLTKINQAALATLPVPVPPSNEQVRIADEGERQLSFIEACERAIMAAAGRSAALRRSVLKAAFEGRLVPQDPSDESASVLVERIRAERRAGDSPKPRRTPRVPSGL